jgi:class 3 adenylate cyclase
MDRRLAAILATDVVGYSRLMEADEAGTLAALKEWRQSVLEPLVGGHHGRIVKLLDDRAIVEFGSVVDAVACAVAVQADMTTRQAQLPADRRVVLRIGINLGDVVIDGGDLLGDGVNVAARLEQLCPPGEVLVSGTAYDHMQGKLGLSLDFVASSRSRTSLGRCESIGCGWVDRSGVGASAPLSFTASSRPPRLPC